jgi:hypothetical protein
MSQACQGKYFRNDLQIKELNRKHYGFFEKFTFSSHNPVSMVVRKNA